jgi:hypothetical protein
MKSRWLYRFFGVLTFVFVLNTARARAPRGGRDLPGTENPARANSAQQTASTTERDGQHDFDFLMGAWKTHISRLQLPLTGSKAWTSVDGTVVNRKVWDGRADLEEIEADGATGHLEGLTLRLYRPQAHQWSLYWANSEDGVLGQPLVGEFHNGRGEFYDQEIFNGSAVCVRNVYFDITANSYRFEQAYSKDGGKTWEPNFTAALTRESQDATEVPAPPVSAEPGQHGFDFELGTWKMRLQQLQHRLVGSRTWLSSDADSFTQKIWGGRGDLEQFKGSGPQRIEGLTLRLYNPQTHQWRLYWATSNDGSMAVPQIGQFRGDRGAFYAQDTFEGRAVWIRFLWWCHTAHFEQAFSDDGGKTWETNWITDQTRLQSSSH